MSKDLRPFSAALAPLATRCRNCGMTAAEMVCHICKQPKYAQSAAQHVPCIAPGGVCHAVGCDEAGECYLWRCEHPHAPKPTTDNDLAAHFAELVLAVTAAREVA